MRPFLALQSIRVWLSIVLLIVALAATGLVWMFVGQPLETDLYKHELQALEDSLSLAARNLTIGGSEMTPTAATKRHLRYRAFLVDGRIGARVVVLDQNAHQVLADSRHGLPLDLRDFSVASRAVNSGTTESQVVTMDGQTYGASAAEMNLASSDIGGPPGEGSVVMLISPLDKVTAEVGVVRRRLIIALGVSVALAAAAGLATSYALSRRLGAIETHATAIAGGDFSKTIPFRVRDEVGRLAEALNMMAKQLEDVIARERRQARETANMLDNLHEGVVATDGRGRISHTNRMARSMLGPSAKEGRLLAEACGADLAAVWPDSAADEDVLYPQLALGSRILEVGVYPVRLRKGSGRLVTLRDVTDQVRVEAARRDFLANASHELKTPLFSLAGFVDMLAEDGITDAERARCIQVIKQQVDRIRRLAVDLLDLSRIESGGLDLHPSRTDPSATVRGLVEEFRIAATVRRVTLEVCCEGAPNAVMLDTVCFERTVRILVDNAVKFSPVGETVTVDIGTEDERLYMRVRNAGDALSPKERQRVFDPFYSLPTTSSAPGGAGLGLAIARSLAVAMGGVLEAEPLEAGVSFLLMI